jgi:hypothetical protein
MYTLLLDNRDNDKELVIKLSIVPRKGDWIRLEDEFDFTEGETLMTVEQVILTPNDETIKVVVSSD